MGSPRRIVILSGSHLCNNPRVVKEADALAAADFDVEVLGWIADPRQAAEDREMMGRRPWRFSPVANLLDRSPFARLQRLWWRAERRGAFALARGVGLRTVTQLGGWRRRLLRTAAPIPADLFIAHSAVTLSVAFALARRGRRVGVDMEDWFSREHAFPHPSDLVAGYEDTLLNQAPHTTCTSLAMSRALAERYRCRPPAVVYNAFPSVERSCLDGQHRDRAPEATLSVHWYSQTIGPHRGLEDLLRAMPRLDAGIEIHLRGSMAAGSHAWLHDQVPDSLRSRLRLHEPVPNAELLSRIAEHDIGFAGERADLTWRALTVTNKIMHYLLGGLAIVASDTPGQREVAAAAPGAVRIYPPGDSGALAEAINRWARDREACRTAKAAALRAVAGELGWEKSAARLVASVAAATSPA